MHGHMEGHWLWRRGCPMAGGRCWCCWSAPCSPLPAAPDSSLTHPARTGGGEERSHLPGPPQELPQAGASVVVPLPRLLTLPRAVSTSLLSTAMVLVLMAQQNPLTALLRQQSRGRAATTSPFLVIAGIWGIFMESAREHNLAGPGWSPLTHVQGAHLQLHFRCSPPV